MSPISLMTSHTVFRSSKPITTRIPPLPLHPLIHPLFAPRTLYLKWNWMSPVSMGLTLQDRCLKLTISSLITRPLSPIVSLWSPSPWKDRPSRGFNGWRGVAKSPHGWGSCRLSKALLPCHNMRILPGSFPNLPKPVQSPNTCHNSKLWRTEP